MVDPRLYQGRSKHQFYKYKFHFMFLTYILKDAVMASIHVNEIFQDFLKILVVVDTNE